MRFLIILYAIGIMLIGLQPLKRYWAPYVSGAAEGVQSYLHWGEPPRRGAGSNSGELPRLVVDSGKVKVQDEAKSRPLDALTSKDKEELDGLLQKISPGAPNKPEKPKLLSSRKES